MSEERTPLQPGDYWRLRFLHDAALSPDGSRRCPAEQSEQFYSVLRANGCVAEMLRLPGSSHGGAIGGKPAIRQAQNEALLDWVERFVPPESGA